MADYVGILVKTKTGYKTHLAYDGERAKTLCGRHLRTKAKHFKLSGEPTCERCKDQLAIINKCKELSSLMDEALEPSIPSNWLARVEGYNV